MFAIMFLLAIISFIIFLIGMIKPKWVIRWGKDEDKTRKKVVLIYLNATFIFIILFAIIPSKKQAEIAKQEKLEQKQKKKEEKEQKKKEEKSKKKEEEFVFDYEFLNSLKADRHARKAAKQFIEEFEMQGVENVEIESIGVYSSSSVRDKAGAEYPYSALVRGRYEESGTGALHDFMMTLVYENAEDADRGNAKCAQYFNDNTATYINAMNEEDDVILKLIEAIE